MAATATASAMRPRASALSSCSAASGRPAGLRITGARK